MESSFSENLASDSLVTNLAKTTQPITGKCKLFETTFLRCHNLDFPILAYFLIPFSFAMVTFRGT